MPFRFDWHQDGGSRQNREIETTPRPRLSVKVAYWLSDVSEPGRGNLKVVPGSHMVNWIDGPPRRDIEWPDPDGAIEVTAEPGDAVFFDRRIWHTRSRNYSEHTRQAVFFGYTCRWTTIRIPSRWVECEMRRLRHANPQKQWEGNDLNDVMALSVAVPYCDVVVTERQWAHFVGVAKLDRRFNTTVISDLRRLPELLGR